MTEIQKRIEKHRKRSIYYANNRARFQANAMRSQMRRAEELGITLDMLENHKEEAIRRIEAWRRAKETKI